jgi:hypothetical protein
MTGFGILCGMITVAAAGPQNPPVRRPTPVHRLGVVYVDPVSIPENDNAALPATLKTIAAAVFRGNDMFTLLSTGPRRELMRMGWDHAAYDSEAEAVRGLGLPAGTSIVDSSRAEYRKRAFAALTDLDKTVRTIGNSTEQIHCMLFYVGSLYSLSAPAIRAALDADVADPTDADPVSEAALVAKVARVIKSAKRAALPVFAIYPGSPVAPRRGPDESQRADPLRLMAMETGGGFAADSNGLLDLLTKADVQFHKLGTTPIH